MNPRTDEIESLESIVDRVKEVLQFLPKDRVWINPDCGFATFANRPVNSLDIIDKKLARLKEAKDLLRSTYE